MYTKQELKRQLAELTLRPDDTVLIHSAMKPIGAVEGGADTVLDAWMEYFAPGLLVLPTHTWDVNWYGGSLTFDERTSKSCVGLLTERFRQRPGVARSLHPTHSVAAWGPDAAAYVAGEERVDTPCGRAGCWGKLLERQAVILLVGCDLSKCTFFHGVEEWCDIEGRVGAPVPYRIRTADGRMLDAPNHRHLGHPSEQFPLAEAALVRDGALTFGRFGDARVYRLDARRACQTVSALLAENPRIFDDPETK